MTYKLLTETKICIYIVFWYNACSTEAKAALSSRKITSLSPRMKTSLSPRTKTAKLQYFLQYLGVDFQDCRITVRRWSITVRIGIV